MTLCTYVMVMVTVMVIVMVMVMVTAMIMVWRGLARRGVVWYVHH